jgi:hypothetical protein
VSAIAYFAALLAAYAFCRLLIRAAAAAGRAEGERLGEARGLARAAEYVRAAELEGYAQGVAAMGESVDAERLRRVETYVMTAVRASRGHSLN